MPVYTFNTNTLAPDAFNDMHFTFNNTSGEAKLWANSNAVETLTQPNVVDTEKSRIRVTDGPYVLGNDFVGSMADFKLTYGIHSPGYIQYLQEGVIVRLFGYRFDRYIQGTNNTFEDSMLNNNLTVTNNKIKFTPVGYVDFVSSLEFANDNTDSYMRTSNSGSSIKLGSHDYDADGMSVCFWVSRTATGIVFHLDNFMTISKTAAQITVTTTYGTASVNISNATSADQDYNADMVFVLVTLPSKTSPTVSVTTDLTENPSVTLSTSTTIPDSVLHRKLYIGHDGASAPSEHFKGILDAVFGFGTLTTQQASDMYGKFKVDDVFATSSSYLQRSKISTEWSHVAATYNATTKDLSVFHNGELFTTYENYIPNTAVISTSDSNVDVGVDSPANPFFKGGLDDIRMYNSILEPRDVNEVYSRYYDHENLNGLKLIGEGSFGANDVVLGSDVFKSDQTGVDYTITIGAGTSLTCKVFAIADHHLSSRQVLDKLLLAESSLVTDFGEFTSTANNQSLSNVIVVSTTEPELTFVETDIANVNSLDLFVYVKRDSDDAEMVLRKNVFRGTDGLPSGRLEIQSPTLYAHVFSASKRLSKYFILFNNSATTPTAAAMKAGIVAFVDTTPNQLLTAVVTGRSGESYCHLMVVDEDDAVSTVVTLALSGL